MTMSLHFAPTHQDSLVRLSEKRKIPGDQKDLVVADSIPYRLLSPVVNLLPGYELVDLDHFLVNYPLLKTSVKEMDRVSVLLDGDHEVYTKLDCLNALSDSGIPLKVFVQGQFSSEAQRKLSSQFRRPYKGLNPFLSDPL